MRSRIKFPAGLLAVTVLSSCSVTLPVAGHLADRVASRRTLSQTDPRLTYKLDLASGKSYEGVTLAALPDSTRRWIVGRPGGGDTISASDIRRIRTPINPTWVVFGIVTGVFVDICIVVSILTNFGN
jgi:hypothetical protein